MNVAIGVRGRHGQEEKGRVRKGEVGEGGIEGEDEEKAREEGKRGKIKPYVRVLITWLRKTYGSGASSS